LGKRRRRRFFTTESAEGTEKRGWGLGIERKEGGGEKK